MMANQQEQGGSRQPQQGTPGQQGRPQQQQDKGRKPDRRNDRTDQGGERMNPDRDQQQHR
jgi:hypothetical protein